jgi:uncharacterized repeat protein (TIGR01451 family)
MRHASFPSLRALLRRCLFLFLVMAGVLGQAQIANGGFETGDFTGWTKTNYFNPGLTGLQPFSGQSIVRQNPGTASDLTFIRTAGTDANVAAVAYPRFGTYCAVVNFGGAGTTTANSLAQTFTLVASMVDPADNLVHIRFAFLPVLNDGAHPAEGQPYFYVGMKIAGAGGATLYDNLNFAPSAAGGPWLNSGGWLYTAWQVQDIAMPQSYLGQNVTIEFIGSRCYATGHAGYLYVDGLSPTVAGLWVSATADRTNVAAGGTITYTYTVRNDSGVDQTGVNLTANLPAQTTLNTSSGLGAHGALANGASYTATMTVNVNVGATGTITHDDFFTTSNESAKLNGPTIRVGVLGPDTDLGATLATAASATYHRVVYTTTITNNGPATATAAQASFALPGNSTLFSASCSQGSVTGLGPVTALLGDIASGGTATLTVTVDLTDNNPATGITTVSGDFTDPTPGNNIASATFTPPALLAITTNPTGGNYLHGSAPSLTVATSGGWGTLTYQWYLGASGDTSNPLVGTNSATYAPPTNVDGSFSYWVRVSDAGTSVDSLAASIFVYSITATGGANGAISPSGMVAVTWGTDQTFTMLPDAGYGVLNVLVDGGSVGALASYTFLSVAATHTISVTFTAAEEEPNNNYVMATRFAGMTGPGMLVGRILVANDLDYYRVVLPVGATLRATVTPPPGGGSYFLYIYNQAGRIVAQSTRSGGAVNTAWIRNTGVGPFYYYAVVRCPIGYANPNWYRLDLTW